MTNLEKLKLEMAELHARISKLEKEIKELKAPKNKATKPKPLTKKKEKVEDE